TDFHAEVVGQAASLPAEAASFGHDRIRAASVGDAIAIQRFRSISVLPVDRSNLLVISRNALNDRAQFWDARRDLKHPGSFKDPGCCPTIRLGHLASGWSTVG